MSLGIKRRQSSVQINASRKHARNEKFDGCPVGPYHPVLTLIEGSVGRGSADSRPTSAPDVRSDIG